MSTWVWPGSIHLFSDEFISAHLKTSDIVAAFDKRLRYLFVNGAACAQLNRQPESLLGRSIIELYPQIIASRNHRNLLRALEGEPITDVIDGRESHRFESIYTPLFEENNVSCVVVRAKQV